MDPIVINVDNPGFFYSLCYITAFLTAFILLTIEGVRRKFSMLSWWLVMATTFLFFMIGSQLIKWNALDWLQALEYQRLSYWPGRSVLGGILFFVPALLLAKRILNFRHNVVDTFAFMFPAGLAIQRVGCLLAGCCHGIPATLPWSIQYNKSAPAFQHQFEHGIIAADAELPLPVHPAQLYDLIGCLAILVILSMVRKKVKATGNLLAISLFLYGFFRLFLEEVKAQAIEPVYYLNAVQIAILVILPALTFFIYRRERNATVSTKEIACTESPKQLYTYSIGLLMLFLFVSRWMSLFEIISFNLVLFPILSYCSWRTYHAFTIPAFRLTTFVLMVIGMFTMSQSYPEYGKDGSKLSYWAIDFGVMSGTSNAYAGTTQTSCGPGWSRSDTNNFSATAIGVSRSEQTGNNESKIYSLNGFWGKHAHNYSNTLTATGYQENKSSWGISPFYQQNWEHIGVGVGFTAGDFSQITFEDNLSPSHSKNLSIYPAFSLRAGRLQEVFFEYRFANQFPTPYPALIHQFSVGGSVGKHGGVFRIGTGSNAGFFLAPSFTFGNHFTIETFASFGSGIIFKNSGADDFSNNMLMINARYKLGQKEKR